MGGVASRTAVVLYFCITVASLWIFMPAAQALGQAPADASLGEQIDQVSAQVEGQVIAWRRDIHEHPELSNREVRTAGVVADHLRKLGLDVRTEVAHTGVVGVLRASRNEQK